MPDLGDGRVLAEPPGELGGVRLRALDPQRERAQAAQREPHLERSGDRPVQRAVRVQPGVQVVVVGQRGAEHDVGVPGEVLGHGVHDDVGAVLERALHQGRRERVVDADQRTRGVRRLDERRQVGDLEHRVGRRLDPEQRRRPRPLSAATTASVSSMSTSVDVDAVRAPRGRCA